MKQGEIKTTKNGKYSMNELEYYETTYLDIKGEITAVQFTENELLTAKGRGMRNFDDIEPLEVEEQAPPLDISFTAAVVIWAIGVFVGWLIS